MKKCSRCKIEKDVSQFSARKRSADGLQHQCRDCKSEYYEKYYKSDPDRYKANAKKARLEVREFARKAKDVPCADCEGKYPYYVMQFDHLGIEDKLRAVSRISGMRQLKIEISKCEVVCANCHAERTWRRLASPRISRANNQELK